MCAGGGKFDVGEFAFGSVHGGGLLVRNEVKGGYAGNLVGEGCHAEDGFEFEAGVALLC